MRAKSAIVAENSEVVGNFVLLLNQKGFIILKFRGKKASRSEEANDIRNINVETTSLGGVLNFKKIYSLNIVQRGNLTKNYFIDLF